MSSLLQKAQELLAKIGKGRCPYCFRLPWEVKSKNGHLIGCPLRRI
jgi:hypothetical protein